MEIPIHCRTCPHCEKEILPDQLTYPRFASILSWTGGILFVLSAYLNDIWHITLPIMVVILGLVRAFPYGLGKSKMALNREHRKTGYTKRLAILDSQSKKESQN